jgi:type II secretory pathway component GspD/PulD (secretin)
MRKLLLLICLAAICRTSTVSAGAFASGKTLTMELEHTPIVAVLHAVARQNNLNLVVSGEVKGNVTMRLENVDIESALTAILTANGYSFYIQDDVIVIKPTSTEAIGELEVRTIILEHLSPITALKALEAIKSERGSVVILDKYIEGKDLPGESSSYFANRLLVTDFPQVVDEMIATIEELDVPDRLVSIQVRIIETNLDSKSQLGIQWPTAVTSTLGGASTAVSETGTGSSTTTSSSTESSSGYFDIEADSWTWGTLSVGQLQAVLDLLEEDGNSKLISDPHITTLENQTATISVETVIPIATINRFTESAATTDIVTFQDEEVGISLAVTPRIADNGEITLDVHPVVEEIIGYSGPIDSQKPIKSSRTITTRIAVQNGETAALGGLLKESEIERTQRFPVLGHIPLIGSLLFTNKTTEKSTTDLIILITPKILTTVAQVDSGN